MRIGIEGKVLSPAAAGIGRYCLNLLRSLAALGAADAEFVLFTGPQTARDLAAELAEHWREQRSPLRSSVLRSLITLPRGIRRHGLDVFHGLDHVGLPWFGGRGRCVVTVHDIMPLEHPEWFRLRHRWVVRLALRRVLRRAEAIIVPSDCVRRDIVRRGLAGEARIVVIPEGCERRFNAVPDPNAMERVAGKYRLPKRYVLFVGTLDPRKNLARLLGALARVEESGLSLVVAGAPGWRADEIQARANGLGLAERVRFTGFVDEQDLPQLYRGAQLFAFPSLYEGFGLPLLEAMACGVPVVASNVSAMPEVAGDAALLVDPRSEEQLAEAISRVAVDDALRGRMRERGARRAAEFTWEQAARRTMEIYRRVAT